MRFGQSFCNGESQAEATVLPVRREIPLLEATKQTCHYVLGHSDSIVGDGDGELRVPWVCSRDLNDPAIWSKLHRIADDIKEDLLKPGRISLEVGAVRLEQTVKLEVSCLNLPAEERSRRMDQAVNIYELLLERKLSVLDPCQIEQIVNKTSLEFDVAAQTLEIRTQIHQAIRWSPPRKKVWQARE